MRTILNIHGGSRGNLIPDSRNLLIKIKTGLETYFLPPAFKGCEGILVWKITKTRYGVYRVGEGWRFYDPKQWAERFCTPMPDWMGYAEMAILGHLVSKSRRRTILKDNLSRITVVGAFRDAAKAKRADRESQPVAVG